MDRTEKLSIEQKSYRYNRKAIKRTEKLPIEQKSYRKNRKAIDRTYIYINRIKPPFLSRKRAFTTFLSQKFMITRSSITFEDFLGSSIAPQVMPPWWWLIISNGRQGEPILVQNLFNVAILNVLWVIVASHRWDFEIIKYHCHADNIWSGTTCQIPRPNTLYDS